MYRSILVAYDGSKSGDEALRQAGELGCLCRSKVHLVAIINPAEAALMWSVGKRRKEAKDFPGADVTLGAQAIKRVGILPEGRAPAREGAEIADKSGRIIGKITSGGFGPSLNAPVAMGYVESGFAVNGTEIDLIVRGKPLPAKIAPTPFVPNRYKR